MLLFADRNVPVDEGNFLQTEYGSAIVDCNRMRPEGRICCCRTGSCLLPGRNCLRGAEPSTPRRQYTAFFHPEPRSQATTLQNTTAGLPSPTGTFRSPQPCLYGFYTKLPSPEESSGCPEAGPDPPEGKCRFFTQTGCPACAILQLSGATLPSSGRMPQPWRISGAIRFVSACSCRESAVSVP